MSGDKKYQIRSNLMFWVSKCAAKYALWIRIVPGMESGLYTNHITLKVPGWRPLVNCPTQLTCIAHCDLCIYFITNPQWQYERNAAGQLASGPPSLVMHVWWSFDVRVVSRGDPDYIISKIYGCRLKLKIVTIQWCVDHHISHDFLMMVADNPHVMLSDSIWMWCWRSGSSNKVFWACLQSTDRPTVELRRLTMVYCRQHQPPDPRAGLIW